MAKLNFTENLAAVQCNGYCTSTALAAQFQIPEYFLDDLRQDIVIQPYLPCSIVVTIRWMMNGALSFLAAGQNKSYLT